MSVEIKQGPPTKYKPEYCEMLIEHMSEGYSFDSFSAIVRVGRMTMYNWCKDFPEWKEAKEIAEGMALKYFETAIKSASMNEIIDDKLLREKFDPKNINVTTMQWFVKCRFHNVYSEKNVTVLEGGDKPVQVENKIDLSKLSLEELKTLRAIKEKVNVESDK
jgi:hypothetical protein